MLYTPSTMMFFDSKTQAGEISLIVDGHLTPSHYYQPWWSEERLGIFRMKVPKCTQVHEAIRGNANKCLTFLDMSSCKETSSSSYCQNYLRRVDFEFSFLSGC